MELSGDYSPIEPRQSTTMNTTSIAQDQVKDFKVSLPSKDLQRRWLLAVLDLYECDGEGLMEDLQITLDRGETFEQFADQCLECVGDIEDPLKQKRKFDR